MRLDIDESSLQELLRRKKSYIGGNWKGGVVNAIGGIGFFITVYSAPISSIWLVVVLYLVGCVFVGIGIKQIYQDTGKRAYDEEKLFSDIKKLSTTESQYSLVAILNDFEGESANKVLLRYFSGGWKTYMFLSYRTAVGNDESNIKARVAADLKVARSQIKVKFLTEVPYQKKYSPDIGTTRMYHNKYYKVFIKNFPEELKQSRLVIDKV